MQAKPVVHKFSNKPFKVFTPEKGTALIMVAPENSLDLRDFSGTRGKFVSLEDGVLTMETQTHTFHIYNFELTFGRDVLSSFKGVGQ